MKEAGETFDPRSASEWSDLRPLLDDAMNGLSRIDRDVILLRYFEGLELSRVGTALGLSEEAARKRVARALDRLRDSLATRGISTTATAITATLVAHAVQVAPAGLATRLANHAVAGAVWQAAAVTPGFSFKAAMTSQTTLIVATATASLLIGTVAVRAHRWRQLEDTLGSNAAVGATTAPDPGLPSGRIAGNLEPIATTPAAAPLATQPTPTTKPESPDSVRVPKNILNRIPLEAVTMPDTELRNYVLTEEFIKTLKLTPSEVDRVTSSLAEAQHRYRIEEGRHLEPTDEIVDDMAATPGIRIVEAVNFRLKPFPEEARGIRRKLESDVLEALGNERATLFLKSAGNMYPFPETVPAGTIFSITYSFRLTDRAPRPLVDLHRNSTTSGLGNGRGAAFACEGFNYGAPLDPYAPESLKPVLARWRKWISDHPGTQKTEPGTGSSTAVAPEADSKNKLVSPGLESPVDGFQHWDEHASYVELPKSVFDALKIAGLTEDQEVSADASALCELTLLEGEAIRGLYGAMKKRGEQLECDHLVRLKSGDGKFAVRAFPEESAALQTEWSQKLKEMLGNERGELLDQLIRTPSSNRQSRHGAPYEAGLDWLRSGQAEIDIEVINGPPDPVGNPTRIVRYKSEGGDCEQIGPGPIRSMPMPKRLRHLLTPDVLKAL